MEVKEKAKFLLKCPHSDKNLQPFGEHSFRYFLGHTYTDGYINSFIRDISMSVNIEIHYPFYWLQIISRHRCYV